MEIDVMEHLTPSKMEEIVEDELRAIIRRFFNEYDVKEIDTNLKRIITNVSYDIVAKMVDTVFNNKLEKMLTEKVTEIIQKGLTQYHIFKKPEVWDNEPNDAYVVLQKAIKSHHGKMKQVVSDNIEKQTLIQLKKILKEDAIVDIIAEIYKEI
jgi:hypothetical protein